MDLEKVTKDENTYKFKSFSNQLALDILLKIIDSVKVQKLKPVSVQMTYDGLTIVRYLMDGRGSSLWLERKAHTVMESGHSSLYVYLNQETNDDYREWVDNDLHGITGGGFPIYVNNELRGTIVVSGLEHTEDHRLVIEALKKLEVFK